LFIISFPPWSVLEEGIRDDKVPLGSYLIRRFGAKCKRKSGKHYPLSQDAMGAGPGMDT